MTHRISGKSFERLIHVSSAPVSRGGGAHSTKAAWFDLVKKTTAVSSYAEVPLKKSPQSAPDARVVSALWRKA